MADTDVQVLELPYRGENLSMIIVLPREQDGLSGFEESISTHVLNRLTEQFNNQKLQVFIPKFKLVSSCELKETLVAMGMSLPFSARANFTGMTKKKELFISEIVHKAFIDVNEEGTEAAAATAVTMRKLAVPMPSEVFRADHPFIFLIRENSSGSILFMGRMVNPKHGI